MLRIGRYIEHSVNRPERTQTRGIDRMMIDIAGSLCSRPGKREFVAESGI